VGESPRRRVVVVVVRRRDRQTDGEGERDADERMARRPPTSSACVLGGSDPGDADGKGGRLRLIVVINIVYCATGQPCSCLRSQNRRPPGRAGPLQQQQ
jgi:hypothetical protein